MIVKGMNSMNKITGKELEAADNLERRIGIFLKENYKGQASIKFFLDSFITDNVRAEIAERYKAKGFSHVTYCHDFKETHYPLFSSSLFRKVLIL